MPTWKINKDGGYMVRSVYMEFMNHNLEAQQQRVSGIGTKFGN